MARYVGLDVHKHFIEVCAIDARARSSTGADRLPPPELEAFAAPA